MPVSAGGSGETEPRPPLIDSVKGDRFRARTTGSWTQLPAPAALAHVGTTMRKCLGVVDGFTFR